VALVDNGTSYQVLQQLNASYGLDFWFFNGSWNKTITFTNAGAATFSSSVQGTILTATSYFTSDYYRDSRLEALLIYAGSNQIRLGSGVGADFLTLYTGGTERMRITSAGQISQTTSISDWSHVISNASTTSPNGMLIQYTGANKNNTSNPFLYCTDNSGTALRMEVRSNGGIANYQGNDLNLSDIRTKKDIIPLESYWDKFKAIEIVKFKYKDQTHDDFNIGVIAQQVEEIAPEFVDIEGWDKKPKLDEDGNEIVNNEEPLKAIYTADLHHATIKVLQECMAKIEEQQAQIEELKQLINK
jgi:hypothetical protein